MKDTISMADMYDLVDDYTQLSIELNDLHVNLDITMETEEGVAAILSMEDATVEDTVYEMLTLNSPETYSAEGIKSAAIATGKVLYNTANKAKTGIKYIAAKTIPVVKVASTKGWSIASKQYRALSDTPVKLKEATNDALELCVNLQKMRFKATSDTIKYRLEGKALSMSYNLPESANDIVKAITNVGDAISTTHKTWLEEIDKMGSSLVKITSSYDKEHPDKTLTEMNKALVKIDINKIVSGYSAKSVNDSRFKRHLGRASDEIPGNLRVFIITPADKTKTSEIDKAKDIRVIQVKTMRTTSKRYNTPSEGVIDVMGLDEVERCLQANLEALKHIDSYLSSGIFNKLKKHNEDMQDSLDKILFRQVLDARWVRVNNAIYMHTGHYMKWCTEPMNTLIAKALSAIRSNITLCKRNLAVYKK